ncbi:hypothetical protein EV356DRAFT_339751 [Viridothelium virens]|uniref:Uncharacterized protein n=1 Tax=Viridothelium virens TaxID=1048519 RepID=A0A6A6GY25_VIRVR|nr:hypothetical protein EV356DRAFT_339751 [Viridothelium virens]
MRSLPLLTNTPPEVYPNRSYPWPSPPNSKASVLTLSATEPQLGGGAGGLLGGLGGGAAAPTGAAGSDPLGGLGGALGGMSPSFLFLISLLCYSFSPVRASHAKLILCIGLGGGSGTGGGAGGLGGLLGGLGGGSTGAGAGGLGGLGGLGGGSTGAGAGAGGLGGLTGGLKERSKVDDATAKAANYLRERAAELERRAIEGDAEAEE